MKHVVAAIGHVRADELTIRDVWAVQAFCEQRGLAPATINKVTHHVFSPMLFAMEACDEIPEGTRDRAFRKSKQLRVGSKRSRTALTIDERDRLLWAYCGHWASPLVHTLFLMGLRVGEAAGLRQSDWDWNRGQVSIWQSRRAKETSITKCGEMSQRVLEAPGRVLAACQELRRDDQPGEFFFRSPEGAPFDADNFRRRGWRLMFATAGVRRIRIHEARHTFVTNVLELGQKNLSQVAAYIGDDEATVSKRYSHVVAGTGWSEAVAAPGLRLVRPAQQARI